MDYFLYWLTDPTHLLLLIFSVALFLLIGFGVLDAQFDITAWQAGRFLAGAVARVYIGQFLALLWILRRLASPWFFGALADVFGSLVSGGPLVYWMWKYGKQAVQAVQNGQALVLKPIDSNEPIAAVGAAVFFGIGIIVCRAIAAALAPTNVVTSRPTP